GAGPTISRTNTIYCDTVADTGNGPLCTDPSGATSDPIHTSRFIYPVTVVDESFPPGAPGPAVMTTTTQLRYDQTGNVLKSLVRTTSQTGETFEKLTSNTYLSTSTIPLRLGKLTQAIVTSQQIQPPDGNARLVQHVTEFDYAVVANFADAGFFGTL